MHKSSYQGEKQKDKGRAEERCRLLSSLVHYCTYSVKKMAVQDNDQGAGLLVDLDLNALNSLEVDLEAVGPLEEPPMVVAL